MKTYSFKELVSKLSEVRSHEDLTAFCKAIDYSFQNGKITGKDNETLYNIVNYVVRREYVG